MPTLELNRTNEEFAAAAANMIDQLGLAHRQYHDDESGCYCTLGAFRMLIFGKIEISPAEQQRTRVPRYLALVDWFAEKVKQADDARLTSETIVSMWNDCRTKSVVVAKLREVAAPTQGV